MVAKQAQREYIGLHPCANMAWPLGRSDRHVAALRLDSLHFDTLFRAPYGEMSGAAKYGRHGAVRCLRCRATRDLIAMAARGYTPVQALSDSTHAKGYCEACGSWSRLGNGSSQAGLTLLQVGSCLSLTQGSRVDAGRVGKRPEDDAEKI